MLAQLVLFDCKELDIPIKKYIHEHEKPYDWNTIETWQYYGFQVAWDEKPRPVAYICQAGRSVPVYTFYQVDLMQKVKTELFNRRLKWLDNWSC